VEPDEAGGLVARGGVVAVGGFVLVGAEADADVGWLGAVADGTAI
jgi:hypothetical protein